MKKIVISTFVVLSIAVAGYFAVDAQQKQYKASQAALNLAKIEKPQAKTERAKGKPVLSDIYIRQAKERYEADPADMDALRVITEQYWLLSKKYIELDKNSARNSYTHLIEENMNNSLQHLEELDSKMSAGWNDPEFRDKNEEIVKSLIKFYHHLKVDYIAANKWRERFIEVWQDKWDAGQQTYEVAYWLYHLNSSWSATYLYDIDKSITGRKTGIAPNTLEIDKWKKIVQKMSQEGKKPIGWSMPHYY